MREPDAIDKALAIYMVIATVCALAWAIDEVLH